MDIVHVDPRSDARWQQVVENHKSSVFHSPAWMRVLTDTYNFEIRSSILINDSGKPLAGLPFCRIADISGDRILSLPFSDYCDPLVGDQLQWSGLIDELVEEELPITLRCLHNTEALADSRFRQTKRAKWHQLDLQADLETLWKGLHESSRRAIRKARKDGVTIRIAETKEELRAFFELHLKVRVCKYHLLAQPYRFFETIWREFIEGGRGMLVLADYQGQIIAGILFLEWGDTLYYKFNASDFTDLSHRPNDLMMWTGIELGKAKGLAALDFGLSDWDQEGLLRYKRKFASEEKTIHFLKYDPLGAPSRQELYVRDLLPKITDLFTRETVPPSVTEQAGDVLYRYFT